MGGNRGKVKVVIFLYFYFYFIKKPYRKLKIYTKCMSATVAHCRLHAFWSKKLPSQFPMIRWVFFVFFYRINLFQGFVAYLGVWRFLWGPELQKKIRASK